MRDPRRGRPFDDGCTFPFTVIPQPTGKRESERQSEFCFNDTPTTEIYTLSLHDALPISRVVACDIHLHRLVHLKPLTENLVVLDGDRKSTRLNSSHVENSYAVFCLK